MVHIELKGESLNSYPSLCLISERNNRPLGRSRCRWGCNIKIALVETKCEGADRIRVAQDRNLWPTVVNSAMNIRISK
jgi:hypothetical protein